jgi:hypothetical protein
MRLSTGRVVLIALVSAMVGSLLGPTVVQAATSVVKIGSGTLASQARVRSHRVWVHTEASSFGCFGPKSHCLDTEVGGIVYQLPGGNDQLGQGTGNDSGVVTCASGRYAVLSSVVVDNPTGQSTVSISADATPFNGSSTRSLLWQGSLGPAGHLDDTFDGGIVFGRTLSVTSTGDARWILNGSNLGCTGSAAVAREIAARRSGLGR